jgi:hypothetical protein
MNKETFDKLDTIDQRKFIARDVLIRLENGSLQPSDFFLAIFDDEEGEWVNPKGETPAKDRVNDDNCQVCAKGALVVSYVGNFNNALLSDLGCVYYLHEQPSGNDLRRSLYEIFGTTLWESIESAYEGWAVRKFHGAEIHAGKKFRNFATRQWKEGYTDRKSRLVALMKELAETGTIDFPTA